MWRRSSLHPNKPNLAGNCDGARLYFLLSSTFLWCCNFQISALERTLSGCLISISIDFTPFPVKLISAWTGIRMYTCRCISPNEYPCLESNVVNTFMPGGIAATASRGTRVGWTGRFTNLLRPVRSTVIRGSSEFFFGTTTIGWHHVIDSPTGTFSIMFFSSIFLSCWWTDSRHLKGIVRALKWRHGIAPSTRSMCMAGPAMGRKGSSWNTSENSSISLALIASVSEKSGGSASSLSVWRNPNVDSSLRLPSKECDVWLTGLSRRRSTDIFWTLSWSVFCVSTWEDGHTSFSRPSLMHVFLLNRDVLSREKTCNVVWQAIPCRLRSTFTVPLGPRLVPFAALTFWVSLAKFQIRSGSILFRSVKVVASTSEPLSGIATWF